MKLKDYKVLNYHETNNNGQNYTFVFFTLFRSSPFDFIVSNKKMYLDLKAQFN